MSIGQELLNVPMGDMIRQMAFAIADAQAQLDESSLRVAETMSGYRILRDEAGNLVDADGKLLQGAAGAAPTPVVVDTRVYFHQPNPETKKSEAVRLSMMELGFTPNFYQFIETVIEVKIAVKITRETYNETKRKGTETRVEISRNRSFFSPGQTKMTVTTAPVDATYSAKYSYSAEGSSLLRTKLVPVPPPAILEERIRRLIDLTQQTPPPTA